MFGPWLQVWALLPVTLAGFSLLNLHHYLKYQSSNEEYQRAVDFNQDCFHFDERYTSLPGDGLHWNINVRTKIECAKTCMANKSCLSIFVDGTTCYGYSKRMHNTVDPLIHGNMKYFEKKGLLGNVAFGKLATLDPLYSLPIWNYTADLAVDGRRIPYHYCAITNKSSQAAWWKVNLEHIYPVTKVAILARDGYFPEQVANIAIGVGNSSSGPFSTCTETTGPDGWLGRFETFTCVSPVYGRFLMLSKIVGYQYMCLCEVEVYVSP